jgi:hypothetical protein
MSDTDDLIARLRDYRAYLHYSQRTEAADRITELQQALVEREATIARVRSVLDSTYGDVRAEILTVLSATPGEALRAHDAEVLKWAAEQCRDGYGPIAAYDAIMKRIREQEDDND